MKITDIECIPIVIPVSKRYDNHDGRMRMGGISEHLVVKVHTDNNCADLLTKCHSKQSFQHLVQLIRSKGMIQQAP